MKWYEKFKVGQKVRVVRKTKTWEFPDGGGCDWNSDYMNQTIGKIYRIVEVNKKVGYRLETYFEIGSDYFYPVDSLAGVKGEQLLFSFME